MCHRDQHRADNAANLVTFPSRAASAQTSLERLYAEQGTIVLSKSQKESHPLEVARAINFGDQLGVQSGSSPDDQSK